MDKLKVLPGFFKALGKLIAISARLYTNYARLLWRFDLSVKDLKLALKECE